jgi:hypothetical protein
MSEQQIPYQSAAGRTAEATRSPAPLKCCASKDPLGCPDVRDRDASWTEWGNLVRTPIENP